VTAKKSSNRVLKEEVDSKPEKEEVIKPTRKKVSAQGNAGSVKKSFSWVSSHIFPSYFSSSWKELRLVTWPNRKETRQLTTAVIIFAIIVGVVVTLIDLVLNKVFKKVILKQ
jgi:preprotein translocase SecE subunit